jgi:phage terminase large subunit-like protein
MTALASALAELSEDERRVALESLSPADLSILAFHWPLYARPDQLPPPGDWRTWLLLGGRGSGKTRSSAEAVRAEIEAGRRGSIGLVGPTSDTLRRDQAAALLSIAPPWCVPSHEPSQRRIVWPNGAVAYLLSSEEPDRIRGLNLDFAWGDELTSWANAPDVWSNLQLALRVPGPKGDAPRAVISTTPKRGALLRTIMQAESTAVTRSRTSDNASNLDAGALSHLMATYGGTSLGRQELDAELLDDVDGALWTRSLIEGARVKAAPETLHRVVVAIDPSGGDGASSDECGIMVVGCVGSGKERQYYVLADYSAKMSPDRWARAALSAYEKHNADKIVAERNFGGDMVRAVLLRAGAHTWRIRIELVTASRGKAVRAEPVVSLYEQGLVHHVGLLPQLEDQLCGWNPAEGGKSPDRLDALVWALTDLSGQGGRAILLRSIT